MQKLAKRLEEKGFGISSKDERALWVGPNIKVEVFNDGTPFRKIKKRTAAQVDALTFDISTYAEMKMAALLCRSIYDPRDLVDLFILKKHGKAKLVFPKMECRTIEDGFPARLKDIRGTKREDLLHFQTGRQIDALPYEDFDEFKRWLHEWLSGFR